MRTVQAWALAVLASGAAADEVAVGPWVVEYDQNGVQQVSYDSTPILRPLTVIVFTPDYKGQLFSLSGSTLRYEAANGRHVLSFEKQTEAARGVATLVVSGNVLRWSADMEITARGHFEMSVPIPAETAGTPAGELCVQIGPRECLITPLQRLGSVSPTEPVRIRTVERDIVLTAQPGPEEPAARTVWPLQDCRSGEDAVVRMVGCLSADGEEVLRASPSITIEVQPLSPEESHRRQPVLGQRSATAADAPVQNAGFEEADTLVGWQHGDNARVDTESPFEGRQCARMEVTSPDAESVYITQNVPVTPGRYYRLSGKVRGENVQPAPVIGMSSVGAALIHEWADPNRKWILPGSYSESLWDTVQEWRSLECGQLRAPEGAGYAVIFLALRGLGMAWFDDIRLTEVTSHTVILFPLDEATMADNRPLFKWRSDPAAASCLVTCAGQAMTIREEVTASEFRPPEPLPPGLYRWHVRAAGSAPSVEWTFRQTAPVDADTTGPEMAVQSQGITDPEGMIEVHAADPSGVDQRSVRLLVDGDPYEATVSGQGRRLLVRPENGWPRGGYSVEVSIADEHGNRSEATGWVVCTPPPPRTLEWTPHQGIFDGQQHFLPVGMYQVKPEDMPRVKEAGFDLVHIYTFEGSQDDAAARQYLDAAQEAGLRVFMGFDRGNSTGDGLVQHNWEHVARRIGALRDHPALLAWYLFDEPDLDSQYVSPENLQSVYKLIKALDPYHPVIVTFAMDQSVARYPQCYDVHWTQVYMPTAGVRSRLLQHRAALPGGHLAAILCCCDREQSPLLQRGLPVGEAGFTPTLRKFRADVAMALALRSSGLSWWWYGDGRTAWLTAADVPQAWDWLSEAVGEVRAIEPLLVSEGTELEASIQTDLADAPIAARARQVGDQVLVIVALGETPDDQAAWPQQTGRASTRALPQRPLGATVWRAHGTQKVRFRLTIPELPDVRHAEVLFEGRQVTVRDGVIRDELPPVGRHVYLLTCSRLRARPHPASPAP